MSYPTEAADGPREGANTKLNPYIDFDPILLNLTEIILPSGVDRISFLPVEHFEADEVQLPHVLEVLKGSGIILFENIGTSPKGIIERQKIANGDSRALRQFEDRETGQSPGSGFNIALQKAIYNTHAKVMPLDVIPGSEAYRQWETAYRRAHSGVLGGNTSEEAVQAFQKEQQSLFEADRIREQYALDHFAEIVDEAASHRTQRKHPNPADLGIIFGDRHLSLFNALRLRFASEDIEVDLAFPDGVLRYGQQVYAKVMCEEDISQELWLKALIEEMVLDFGNAPQMSTIERREARRNLHTELDILSLNMLQGTVESLSKPDQPKQVIDERVSRIVGVGLRATIEGA